MAETFWSLRALRSSVSCARSFAEGRRLAATLTVSAPRAVSGPETPPVGAAITRASPPWAGRSQSADPDSLVEPVDAPSGSGRAEVNRRSPDRVKTADDSPLAERVSRRAGASPAGSTSQRAVR
jgi:hypothetical protein